MSRIQQEMLGKGPVLLDAVLLPFRDSIISDGLVMPYNIHFGKAKAAEARAGVFSDRDKATRRRRNK